MPSITSSPRRPSLQASGWTSPRLRWRPQSRLRLRRVCCGGRRGARRPRTPSDVGSCSGVGRCEKEYGAARWDGKGGGGLWVGSGVTSRLGDFCVRGDHLVGLGSRGRLAGGMAAARFQHVGSCSARARTRGCEEATMRTQQAGHRMPCHTSSFPLLPPLPPSPEGGPYRRG